MRRVLPVVLVLAAGSAPVLANWTASGTCAYVDREFDANGFTGAEPIRPIRLAAVQVVDGQQIVGSGVTDTAGSFIFAVSDNKTRDIHIRCLARFQTSTGIPVEVRSTSSAGDVWSIRGPTISGHAPNQNVSAGTLVAVPGSGGEAFNLYDNGLYGTQYLNFLRGGEAPAVMLQIIFNVANSTVSAYNGTAIVQARNAGYDDTVMLHEMGHYVQHRFSAFHSPGGAHQLSNCNQDLRLAFDEGHATFFGNSVRRYHGFPHSSTYVRTTGQAGAGNLQFSFDVETQQPFVCYGSSSETTVYTALWDLGDGPSTTDGSPGTDESWDLLQGLEQDYFQVMNVHLPTASNISLEDFWDGWFHPSVNNGHHPEMLAIFRQLGVEYEPDMFELNDLTPEARLVTPGPAVYHLTYFADRNNDLLGEADVDLFTFDAVGGSPYTIETFMLRSDANTSLQLLTGDGLTLLASNDDRAVGDKSSLIAYTPSGSARFMLKSFHGPGFGIYGSYDLRISGAAVGIDIDGDGFTVETDCNDNNPSVHPGAVETCNLIDDDCDTVIDEGFDQDSDGVTTCGGDCNNVNPQIRPGAPELCNGIDDDCDLTIDEGGFSDSDGDGILDCVDSDDDNDGAVDAMDCAPMSYLASSPPAEVAEQVSYAGATTARLHWQHVPQANIYNIYRVAVPLDGPRNYGVSCLLAELAGVQVDDPEVPALGTCFAYLESGRNECGEGSLGLDSAGVPRAPVAPCAPQGLDSDGDLVLDLVDVCPHTVDPAQEDSDRDGRGTPCDNCPNVVNASQVDQDQNGVGDACQDVDLDGHPVQSDCDDANPAIHPGAVETFNNIDDDCDGVIDDVVETIVVTLATWQSASQRLTVEATTNYPAGSVTFSVTGFGAMTYVPASDLYRLVVQPVANPGSVTVTSTGGGSAASPVTPL